MPTLAQASLAPAECRALERLVERLEVELGDRLVSVWLYGSRRESPGTESNIDVMVIAGGDRRGPRSR
jgi:predicted nucleotidyltransferase